MEQGIRVSPYPIPELAEYLRPFRVHFYRCESLRTLECLVTGLLSDVPRKSGAGVAQAVAGLSEGVVYRLLVETEWDEVAFNRQRVGTMLRDWVAGDGVLVVDEGSYPRKGDKCVGVARQYCGELGKVANCQVFVTTHYMDPHFAWPVNGRLYLPEEWANDAQRRAEAGIPEDVVFQTKPEIALDLIDEAREMGVPVTGVVADGAYGGNLPRCASIAPWGNGRGGKDGWWENGPCLGERGVRRKGSSSIIGATCRQKLLWLDWWRCSTVALVLSEATRTGKGKGDKETILHDGGTVFIAIWSSKCCFLPGSSGSDHVHRRS